MFFSIICGGLFIGLSFGLKSHSTKVSNDYQTSLQVSVRPKTENGTNIDPSFTNQIRYNLKNRLELNYPNDIVNIEANDDSFLINITNIDNESEKVNFLNQLVNKNALTFTFLKDGNFQNFFFQNSINNNNVFIKCDVLNENSRSYEIKVDSMLVNQLYRQAINQKSSDIVLWKNFETLKAIAQNDPNFETVYEGNYYAYMYENGWTPEKKSKLQSSLPVLLKQTITAADGTKYSPYDFLVSKNPSSDYDNNPKSIIIKKEFGDKTNLISLLNVQKEFYDINYWVSNYQFNDYIASIIQPTQGNNSYIFLIVAFVSFYALLSIFCVISYGYLGLFAIFLLAIINFLSLMFIGIFIGNYDTISITIILVSTILATALIIPLSEKFKREFKKGNSVEKSIKNTIKVTTKSDWIKALILVGINTVFYLFLAQLFANFTIVLLLISIFNPLIMILGFRSGANLIVGISKLKKESKLIGFWKKDFDVSKTNGILKETVANKFKIKSIKTNEVFVDYKNKGMKLTLFSAISLGVISLVAFLISFFVGGKTLNNALNLSNNEKNQIVLRVSLDKPAQSSNEAKEIQNYLISNGAIKDTVSLLDQNTIQAYYESTFLNGKLNEISNHLMSTYNVKVIAEKLTNSNTFKIMQFAIYAALVAMVLMCIFVLFWLGWAKALVMFISSLISISIFIIMIGIGLIQINPIFVTSMILATIIFAITNLNLFAKIHGAFKNKRIEEMTKDSITATIDTTISRELKSMLISNSIIVAMMLIFSIFVGALPCDFALFIAGFTIINLAFLIFVIPRLLIFFETIRARNKREKILNDYWETEKIKEQVFNGINNVK